ncbi:MAG TPA: hypothetical protein PLC04_05840 [Candidatus Kapabacteria bacterium]|jgi:hypothetical protein|nr:hypothetical protein [Candidatus Kapabacteria bacterium]HOV92579.1 hypothetical protein [Candidatus Kapabacteria bacterium]
MKRNKVFKIINLVLFISISILMSSCCDCPLIPNDEPKCNPLEATITKFEPGRVKINDTTTVPVDSFSIHSFAFPMDYYTTGTLLNDERFRDVSEIMINKIKISSNPSLYIAYYNRYPLNSEQIGDILIKSVNYDDINPDQSSAVIRVKGYLNRLTNSNGVPIPFYSDNAQTFCEFIDANKTFMDDEIANAPLFGKGILDAVISPYDPSSFVIIDENNNIISGYIPPQDVIDNFFNTINAKSVDIIVHPGDVFIYRTPNNVSFIFAIVNIGRGFYEPYKNRVTIMFSKI